jgi:hypothetical protein
MMGVMTEPDLGYIFYPGPSQFGEERFAVVLRPKPTNKHFDPEKVHLKVNTSLGVQVLDIRYPWRQTSKTQLCLGHIRVFDRYQKFIDVFSFGGWVEITAVTTSSSQAATDKTTCIISSPAPLLELTAGNSTAILLANEIDIQLAQLRARLNPRFPAEFDGKLAVIEPLDFYVSCLSALRKKFAYNTIYQNPTRQRFKHKLNLEIARLQHDNNWPSSIPTLAELIDQRP